MSGISHLRGRRAALSYIAGAARGKDFVARNGAGRTAGLSIASSDHLMEFPHMPRYGSKASQKVERAMHEMKRGQLKSGRSGKTVRSRKQAIAIGLSEARRAGGKVPKRAGGSRSRSRGGSRSRSRSRSRNRSR